MTLDEVLDAYSKIDLKPCTGRYVGDGECCPIAAIVIRDGWSGQHASVTFDKRYDTTGRYRDGFTDGFDGNRDRSKDHPKGHPYVAGYKDGLAVMVGLIERGMLDADN